MNDINEYSNLFSSLVIGRSVMELGEVRDFFLQDLHIFISHPSRPTLGSATTVERPIRVQTNSEKRTKTQEKVRNLEKNVMSCITLFQYRKIPKP